MKCHCECVIASFVLSPSSQKLTKDRLSVSLSLTHTHTHRHTNYLSLTNTHTDRSITLTDPKLRESGESITGGERLSERARSAWPSKQKGAHPPPDSPTPPFRRRRHEAVADLRPGNDVTARGPLETRLNSAHHSVDASATFDTQSSRVAGTRTSAQRASFLYFSLSPATFALFTPTPPFPSR